MAENTVYFIVSMATVINSVTYHCVIQTLNFLPGDDLKNTYHCHNHACVVFTFFLLSLATSIAGCLVLTGCSIKLFFFFHSSYISVFKMLHYTIVKFKDNFRCSLCATSVVKRWKGFG